jgi:hypothetical protein
MMLEVVYIGNHAVHLPIKYTQLNGIPRQYLSTLATRDPNQTYLTSSVANPFSGLQTSQNTATTTPVQLLARYPEFPVGDGSTGWSGSGGVLEQNLNDGRSYFQSVNIRLQKRASHGLTFVFNYIYSRLMEQTTWLNDSDPVPEKRVSPIDHPQRYVTAITYELPIGKGKALDFHSRLANSLVGGWLLNNVYTFQVGGPLLWVNGSSSSPGDYVYLGGGSMNLDNRQVNGPAFNTALFDIKSADAFNYHLRTFPTAFSNLRADGINQWDPSLSKRFTLTEKASVQIRMEAYNVLNHPVFAAPSTTASNSAFGTITATANRFRTIQLGARLVW